MEGVYFIEHYCHCHTNYKKLYYNLFLTANWQQCIAKLVAYPIQAHDHDNRMIDDILNVINNRIFVVGSLFSPVNFSSFFFGIIFVAPLFVINDYKRIKHNISYNNINKLSVCSNLFTQKNKEEERGKE